MLKRNLLNTVIISLIVAGTLHADPLTPQQKHAAEARLLEQKVDGLLQLEPGKQKEEILKLTIDEAEALKSTLSRRLTSRDPEAATVFYLYEHLANLDAIDLAQKRLDRLLLVLVITLLLFVGYLLFLLMQQNRIVRTMRDRPDGIASTEKQVDLYRGE